MVTDIKDLAQQPKKGRRLLFAGIAAVGIIGVIGAFMLKPKPAPTQEENRAADQLVTAVSVVREEFERTAPVSGEARPVHDVRVFAPAPGVRIAAVMAEIGDQVEEGQPLARLDAGVADAQEKEAEALLKQAQVEYARAKEDYERIAPIAESGALSIEEVSTKRAAMEAAAARLTAQKAALEQVSARMGGGYVRAPASGLIIERNALVGEYADQKSLFRIVGENRLEVAAAVSEGDILSLKTGQTAVFKSSDGAAVEGTLRVPPVAVDSRRAHRGSAF
ncbi:MAG: efflux RND transporter periplasmic adaptor subunit [Parvularculaceae bacterium]